MSARELIALGTASQVPTRYRNHMVICCAGTTTACCSTPARGPSGR
ncbi:hypothetical protein OV079_38485 [Nannocystis pusilla]|uniref:Uncharacterized protein n=1 Tax=Nannocystis pusilla TaxID=889268 RepID=A0A9X3J1Q1_9BACT|nr:hypothetical protein [Nannocystis pusilla]MCY1011350.1 hypothetical protein [Nannocystis pusilla]